MPDEDQPQLSGREILYCAHVMGLIEKAARQHARARGNYMQRIESATSQIQQLREQIAELRAEQMAHRDKRLKTTWRQPNYSEATQKMLASTKANRAFRATTLLEARSWEQIQEQRRMRAMEHKEINADAHVRTRDRHHRHEAWYKRQREEELERQGLLLAHKAKQRLIELSGDDTIPPDVRGWLGTFAEHPELPLPEHVQKWLHRHPP